MFIVVMLGLVVGLAVDAYIIVCIQMDMEEFFEQKEQEERKAKRIYNIARKRIEDLDI